MINVGVVGCGCWGVNHVRVFSELAGSTVSRVCDLHAERLACIRQRYPSVRTGTDIRDMCNDVSLDAVVVSTPAMTHYEIIQRCLLAGKHVLSEKPLTTSADQAEKLVRLASKAGKILMVGHTFLYNDGIRRMRDVVAQESGNLYYLCATRTNLGPIRQDVNVAWDLASHDVYIFNYLLGALPTQVSAVGRRLLGTDREDVAFITLTYPGNIIANIHVSWVNPTKVREIVVVGSKNRIVFNDLDDQECLRIFDGNSSTSSRVERAEPLRNQNRHFLACVEQGANPLSDGADGYDVIRVLAAVDRSLQSNGQPTDIVDG